MQYNEQFKISPDVVVMDKNIDRRIEYLKNKSAAHIGLAIGEVVGFKEKEPLTEFELRVQAFSQDDWAEFKKNIYSHISTSFPEGKAEYELKQFKTFFENLEMIGFASIPKKYKNNDG